MFQFSWFQNRFRRSVIQLSAFGIPLFYCSHALLLPYSIVPYFKVNSGNLIRSPPFIADSWANIPTQVIFADSTAFG